MPKEIITQLESALNDTLHLVDSLSENDLNKVPFEGSWTAAQVARHLYKSEAGIDQMFYAPSKPVERAPDEKAAWLKELFLNFETKMKSPDFILPEEQHYDKDALGNLLKEEKEKVLEAVNNSNLNEEAVLGDDHPLKGNTKLEILHFLTYHTMRHNHQIRKIKEALD